MPQLLVRFYSIKSVDVLRIGTVVTSLGGSMALLPYLDGAIARVLHPGLTNAVVGLFSLGIALRPTGFGAGAHGLCLGGDRLHLPVADSLRNLLEGCDALGRPLLDGKWLGSIPHLDGTWIALRPARLHPGDRHRLDRAPSSKPIHPETLCGAPGVGLGRK